MNNHGPAIEELLESQQPISRRKFNRTLLSSIFAIGGGAAWLAWYKGLLSGVGDTAKHKIIDEEDRFEIVLPDKNSYGLEDCTTKNDDYKFAGYAKFRDNWWDLYDATNHETATVELIKRVGINCNGKQIRKAVLNNDASTLFHYMRPLYDDNKPINLEQIAKEGGHKVFTVKRFHKYTAPEYKHIHFGNHYLVPVPHAGPPIDAL